MQAAGARIVPIIREESEESILKKVSMLDGIFYPGGNGDYGAPAQLVWDELIKQNDAGHFYPAWGTCLGYETFGLLTATDPDTLWNTDSEIHHVSLPIEFTMDTSESSMFCQLEDGMVSDFQTGNYTYNSHKYSLDPKKLETDAKFGDFWTVTSTSKDFKGTTFIASMEAKNYPIMGTQFHPEKATQIWYEGVGINHTWQSTKMNRYFADLFV